MRLPKFKPSPIHEVHVQDNDSPWRWGILISAALVVLGVGVRAAGDILAPVFLAVNLVITAYPLQDWLRRRRLPSWMASLYSIAKLATVIPDYSQQFQDLYNRVIARLTRFGVGEDQLREIFGKLDVTNFTGVARTLLSTLSSGLSLLLLVVTLIIFVAMDAPSTARRLDWIAQSRPPIAAGLREFGSKVRTYWVVSTVFGLIVAILDGVALQIIDVPLVMTWAVLAFVTNYIPNVGFVIGLIPPALLALLDSGVSKMVAVIIIYASINFVVQTVIQPKLTGDAVGINATTAFVSLVFWAYLLGPLGALLAIPATILVKSTLLDHTSGAQWVSALISSASEPNPVPIPPVQVSTRGHTSPY
jgi:predicted PurR-regulated permease PerM